MGGEGIAVLYEGDGFEGFGVFEGGTNAVFAGADELFAAVYHHLWGVDAVAAVVAGVGALALGCEFAAEGVFPVEVIPVGDVEGEGDDVGVLAELGQIFVGGRAG